MKYWILSMLCFLIVSEASSQCKSGDCENGRGAYVYPSGAVYRGEFADGEIHGIGECRYSDGRRYIGEWVHRYPEGKGIMHLNNGTKLKGYWKKGRFLGEDPNNPTPKAELVETETGEEIQTGCILGDCKNGNGTYVYADGSKYEGRFKNHKFNGEGTYFYADGSKYVGDWRDSYYHGEGVKTTADKTLQDGLWQSGEYVGTKDGINESGCLSGLCENGEGTYVFKDGSKYIGEFKGGDLTGYGICYYPNGNKYVGNWQKSNFHGLGAMTFANGVVVRGIWEEGAFVGESELDGEEQIAKVTPKNGFNSDVKVWAVIVGVAKYNHMPMLNYTDDDAYRMYAFLMSPSGGALEENQVKILVDEDATRRNIIQTMQNTYAQADSNDVVLLYFSGHGFKGAFLPFDFDGYNNKLFHKDVKNILNTTEAKYKLCIADACHSGSLNEFTARGSANSVISSYYKAFKDIKGGTALLLSSKSDETSLESSGLRQGIFSHFLIRGMKGEADKDVNKIVTIRELFNYIHKNVKAYTGNFQTPILDGDFDDRMPVSSVRK